MQNFADTKLKQSLSTTLTTTSCRTKGAGPL